MRKLIALRIAVWSGLASLCACSPSSPTPQAVEAHGLRLLFTPVCANGKVALQVSMTNVSSEPLTLEHGIPPWEYGPLGTKFKAESAGQPLEQPPFYPTFGRTGPIKLAPSEEISGKTPIGSLFPELPNVLKSQAVTVRWSYPMPTESGHGPIEGQVAIPKDPCAQS